jgi:hypothetical protein
MGYKVVNITAPDQSNICELYENAFGKSMCSIDSSQLFLWFFVDNVFKTNFGRGIHDGERILAYWGLVPVKCKMNSEIVNGSLAFQLVSSQQVIGATMFLWKGIQESSIKNSIVISYAFINDNSYPLLKEMGWVTEETPILISLTHPFILAYDLLKRFTNNKVLLNLTNKFTRFFDYLISKPFDIFHSKNKNVIEVGNFDETYNRLWDSMSPYIINGVNYDLQFMKWRYLDKPNNNYKILCYKANDKIEGYLVYRTKNDFGSYIGFILEIIADPNNKTVVNALINHAKWKLSQEGVTMISALSFRENMFYKNFRTNFFFNLPQIFSPQKSYFTIFNFLNSSKQINIKDWHISWGNHDNY